MSPWKVILATMVIFVCGVVTGALVIRTQGWHPSFPPGAGRFSNPNIGLPGRAPVDDVVRQLKGRLELTTNQCEKIAKIMQDSQSTIAGIRQFYAPQIEKEVEKAHQAITNWLNPEQQIKYAALLKEQNQRPGGRGDYRGRRGGDGPGFPPRSNNWFQTNGSPWDGRGRSPHRGPSNDFSGNDSGTTDLMPAGGLPAEAISTLDESSPSNRPSLAAP